MSIEKLLTDLTAAIEANTAALLGGGAASKPSGTKSTKTTKTTKPKGPSLDDLTKFAGQIMQGETDVDADDGKKILMAFKKERGCKVSETPAEDVAEALEYLKAAVAEMADGGGESEEDLM